MQMLMKILSYVTFAVCAIIVAAMLPFRLVVACWGVAEDVLESWLGKVKEKL